MYSVLKKEADLVWIHTRGGIMGCKGDAVSKIREMILEKFGECLQHIE